MWHYIQTFKPKIHYILSFKPKIHYTITFKPKIHYTVTFKPKLHYTVTFKPKLHYTVTCVIMQKNGAGLHTASSCFWDNTTDGWIYNNNCVIVI